MGIDGWSWDEVLPFFRKVSGGSAGHQPVLQTLMLSFPVRDIPPHRRDEG